ncbi:hypothetical protein HNR46_003394 [Haloferula luteola]|uniref:Carboxypeptidase regulatory-like domain-containing protein n=1 Tax=Haloferula luteola TaxID=595692 RepID=A0A840VKE7_9BACT|nr:carboxypeptidase-like regulatory domain-containing protein [Haloferula luteola]MBB5353141.1 hypothetical protein [Haloferula luteola]
MNNFLIYGVAIFLLGIATVIFVWKEPPKNKESQGKAKQESPHKIASSKQENLRNVLPVKDGLSVEKIRQAEQENGASRMEKMKDLLRRDYSTPIDFWGKVVDQNGNPIVGVKADIVIDEQAGMKSYVVFSDEKGLFELLGKKGARARVRVTKDGYAATSNETMGSDVSSRTIYYSMDAMPAYAPPTRDNPQVFVLRKKNPPADLGYSEKDHVAVNKNGTPQKIALRAGGKAIEIEVRCWSSCPVPFSYDKYDWRAEIRVSAGKLRAITEIDPVTAPTDGYQPVFRLEMPKDMEGNWIRSSPNGTRDFWIQFDDSTYAKARIEVKTGRTHEADAEVWYNLDGTNNFEQ